MYYDDYEEPSLIGKILTAMAVILIVVCIGLGMHYHIKYGPPPRPTIRQLVTEIHQKIVIEGEQNEANK